MTVKAPTEPAFRLPLSVPLLAGNEWVYLKECLNTGWVSSVGPFVDRFERAIAAQVETAHAVAVVNGTSGLHLALRAVSVQADEEVLVSALTFIAPVNAIRYCGAHPVFIDADPGTWQMDVDAVEGFLRRECELREEGSGTGGCYNRRTGRRIRAILPVHILGLACEMDRLLSIAHRYGLRVVEDAAEGIGVRYRGRHIGGWGDVGVLSFNGNKLITCGGGGMVVTNDSGIHRSTRDLSTQAKDDGREYVYHAVGYNYRLTNLHAALGLAQLEQLGRFIERKRRTAQIYADALGDLEGVTLMPSPPHTEATFWLYTVLLRPGTTVEARRAALDRLDEQGIEARPLWHPIHSLPPYQGCQAVDITVAPDLHARAISLPSSVGISEADLERGASIIRRTLQSY